MASQPRGPRLVIGDVRPALFAFAAAAAGLLLLITCINVANLLVVGCGARAGGGGSHRRRPGRAHRSALELCTENLLLAIAGGLLGVAVAAGAVRLFAAFAPPDPPLGWAEVHLNTTALAGALKDSLLSRSSPDWDGRS